MNMQETYHFSLKCWGEDGRWRWSLKKSDQEDRIGFPDLDSLYLYLSRLTEGDESLLENDPKSAKENAEENTEGHTAEATEPPEGSKPSQGSSQTGEPHE